MSLQNRRLTEGEKAVIYYHVFGGIDDWRLLYTIANMSVNGKVEDRNLDQYTSKWKNSDKVRNFIKALQDNKATEIAEARLKAKEEAKKEAEESERVDSEAKETKNKIIDYSDPKNRQQLYNKVIAEARNDPKTQLDAAKMFEQIQKDDREAAKAQKQSRVYLPLRCENCALYMKAKKKTTK